jgi:hypothetical protein
MRRRSMLPILEASVLLVFAAVLTSPVTGSAAGLLDTDVDLKVWSRAVFNVHYDTDDIRGDTDFATYITSEGNDEVNFNPRDTRFGFSAQSTEEAWNYRCVFEIDFYGDNAGNNLLPRLRLGYAELSNDVGFSLRAGQDWIPIAQQNPGTLDFGILSWGGNLWWRVPQLTARYQTGAWEMLGSLMKHRISSTQENQEKMPWALGRLAWNGLARGRGTLAIGAGYRSVEVDGVEYAPWLVVGELKVPLGQRLTLASEVWTGKGFAREFVRYGLDYNTTTGTEIESMGGFGSLGIKATEKTSFNFGYGMDNPKDEDLTGSTAAPFELNQVFFGNIKHNLSSHYGLGLEVMHFITEQTDGTELTGERVTTSYWFIF